MVPGLPRPEEIGLQEPQQSCPGPPRQRAGNRRVYTRGTENWS